MRIAIWIYWAALFAAVGANVVSNVAFKLGMQRVALPTDASPVHVLFEILRQPWLWVGGVFAAVLLGLYLFAVKGVPLGVAYPTVAGLAMVGIHAAGILLLGERFSVAGACGVLAIVLGVCLLARV
jgi:multidrug transporter EmrE-like cation transporter